VSNNNEVSQTTAATLAPDPVMTPEAIVEQLRILRAQIPNYVQLSIPESASLRTVSSLNPQFTQAAIDAVGASPRVEGTVGHSAETLQGVGETAARLTKVEEELAAMLDGVSSAIMTLRHGLGRAALLAYAVTKKLVKEPEHADLIPHLASMRKANRLGRSRKTQPPVPAPVPSTPAPAPSTPTPAPAPVPTPHI
jgi:hypothetical protein